MALHFFAGASTTAESCGEYLTSLAEAIATACDLDLGELKRIHYPPEANRRYWAKYQPLGKEIAEVGWRRAYLGTTRAARGQLWWTMADAWEAMELDIKAGKKLVLVGQSNGAIPAMEFAICNAEHIAGVLLLSGAPVPEQVETAALLPFQVVMTMGERESCFGGAEALADIAAAMGAKAHPFDGGHAGEDERIAAEAAASLRSG